MGLSPVVSGPAALGGAGTGWPAAGHAFGSLVTPAKLLSYAESKKIPSVFFWAGWKRLLGCFTRLLRKGFCAKKKKSFSHQKVGTLYFEALT